MIEALSSLSAKVNAVTSAKDSLVAFQNVRPDLIVSDISMPGEDGYSLIRKILKLNVEHGSCFIWTGKISECCFFQCHHHYFRINRFYKTLGVVKITLPVL